MPWREDNPTLWIDPDPLSYEEALQWAGWNPRLTKAREELEKAGVRFVPWVEFYSLERAGVGVLAVEGDPTSGRILATKELKEIPYFEPLAPLHEFKDALEALVRGNDFVFEEHPFGPIENKEDFIQVLKAMNLPPEDEPFEGPGIYDFRDKPPSKSDDSAEDYERGSLEQETGHLIDYIFTGGIMGSDLSGEEWKKALIELMEEAADELVEK